VLLPSGNAAIQWRSLGVPRVTGPRNVPERNVRGNVRLANQWSL
jgi:hypothetical protein